MRPPANALDLPVSDRLQLEAWVCSPQIPACVKLRCHIILAAARGESNVSIAQALGITRPTVILWRGRFKDEGSRALLGGQGLKPGPKVAHSTVRRVLALLDRPSPGGGLWTIREMAESSGLSPATIHRIWEKEGIKTHLLRTFTLTRDSRITSSLHDFVAAYSHPPYHALLVSADPGHVADQAFRPRGTFFLHLRFLDTLRAQQGFQTHTPAHFMAFLKQAAPRVRKYRSVRLIANMPFLEAPPIRALIGPSTWIGLHLVPEEVGWHDLMRWWLQPLVAEGLARGRLCQFPHLESALTRFLQASAPDPFTWIAETA